MNPTRLDPIELDGVGFVLLLLLLPLVSFGTTRGIDALWWLGLVLLVGGGVISILTHFVIEG